MKTLLVALTISLAGASTASAEIYRPSVVGQTAVLGAVAGALIGGHNGDRWAEGAVIGAAAGAVLGTVVDQSRPVQYAPATVTPVAVVPNAPMIGAPAPAVVYVTTPPPAPAVVYVDTYAPPVVVSPFISFSTGWHSGYWGHSHRGYPVYYRHGGHHWSSGNRPGHDGGHHHGGGRGHR